MAGKRATAARVPQVSVAPPDVRTSPATRAVHLDRLVHDRTRLAIVSTLAVNQSLSFTELRATTGTTDGNLSVHARKLEEAGYITCTKGYDGRTPKTEFSLTDAGRRALQKYLDHMEAIIRHARPARR